MIDYDRKVYLLNKALELLHKHGKATDLTWEIEHLEYQGLECPDIYMISPSFDGSTGWGEHVRRATITEDGIFDSITNSESWIDHYLWNADKLAGEDKVLARLACFIFFSYVGDGMFDETSAMAACEAARAAHDKNGAED